MSDIINLFRLSQELWSVHPSKLAFQDSGQDDARPDDLTGRFAFNGIIRQVHQAVHGFHNPKTNSKVQGVKDRLDTAEQSLAKARENDPEGLSWEVEQAEATVEQIRTLWAGLTEFLDEAIAEYNTIYSESWSPDMNSAPAASAEVRASSRERRKALLEAAGITIPESSSEQHATSEEPATGTDG